MVAAPPSRSGPQGVDITVDVPAQATIAVIGDEASGVDALGSYAMGLVPPPHGRALVFGQAIAEIARPTALAFGRKVGYLPAGDGPHWLARWLSIRAWRSSSTPSTA